MENATKALIMAAGVLIGIMILSLGVYLFSILGSYSASVHKKIEDDTLKQINSRYTVYDGRNDLTVQDVVTIVNAARDNNKYYYTDTELAGNEDNLAGKEGNYYIAVRVSVGSTGNSYTAMKDNYKYKVTDITKSLLQNEITVATPRTYSCNVSISEKTGRVYFVRITKNE